AGEQQGQKDHRPDDAVSEDFNGRQNHDRLEVHRHQSPPAIGSQPVQNPLANGVLAFHHAPSRSPQGREGRSHSLQRPSSQASLFWYSSRRRRSVSASGCSHRPRSAASRRRSTIARSAHGLARRRNALTRPSSRYASVSCSYIQSSSTSAVAS